MREIVVGLNKGLAKGQKEQKSWFSKRYLSANPIMVFER